MNLKPLFYCFFIILILSGFNTAFAQTPKKLSVDKQRSLKWKPEKGQYYFSHALTFEYQNKTEKTKGEIVVFLDPVTGTMCFRKESSFGEAGKTFDFVIATQEGKFIFCGTDNSGKKIRTSEIIEEVKPDQETKDQQKEEFSTYCIPTGNKRADFEWESLEYHLTYPTSDTKDKIWITAVPFGTYPLYGFDLVEAAASLPVSLDFSHIFGPNQLLTEINSADTYLHLKSVEPNPFLAVIALYSEVKTD
jgi:hypothetical protein